MTVDELIDALQEARADATIVMDILLCITIEKLKSLDGILESHNISSD